MRVAVYLPLVLTAVFGLIAPVIARQIKPRVATWLLTAGGLAAAATCGAALSLLGLTWAARFLASAGHWSNRALDSADPVKLPIAIGATLAAAVILARLVGVTVTHLRAARAAHRLAEALPGPELAVLDSPLAEAFAVPGGAGRPGRIVITTAVLRALPAGQRRALLEHERTHLDQRHHLHHTAAAMAATNPLLRTLRRAVALSCEREADEAAARLTGRDTTAAALRSAHASARTLPAAVLAATATDVEARIDALNAPPPTTKLWRIGLLVAVLVAAAVAVIEAAHDTEHLFDLAQAAYRTR